MRAKVAAGVFFFRKTLSTTRGTHELFTDQMALCHPEYTMKTLVSVLAITVTLAFMQTAEAGDDKHRWRHGRPNIDINILIPSAFAAIGFARPDAYLVLDEDDFDEYEYDDDDRDKRYRYRHHDDDDDDWDD